MSDEKLLTVEEVGSDLRYDHCYGAAKHCYSCRATATVKALAERLARVEECSVSACIDGYVPAEMASGCGEPCQSCKDHPGLAHKDWQSALRKLGEGG